MKGRYVQLAGSGETFDRNYLVQGVTKSGRQVPSGGVMLRNGTLAGYIHQDGGYDKTWTIIGQLQTDDPNTQHVPTYSIGGHGKSGDTGTSGGSHQKSSNKQASSRPVSLKTAVKMLRDYYRNNFN